MQTKCSSCGGGAAVAWCQDCVESLCQDCIEAHKRVKLTRSHILLSRCPEGFPRQDFPAISPRICPVHPKEVLQLYCFTCDRYTCRDCQLMDHRNHDFQFVRKAYQSVKKQMYEAMSPVEKHTEAAMQSIEDMRHRLKDIQSSKAHLKTTLLKVLENLLRQFKRRFKEHLCTALAIYKCEEDLLRSSMQDLLVKIEDYTIRIRTIEKDATDLKTLVARKNEIESWSKWVLSQEVNPPKSMTTVTINPATWDSILSVGDLEVSHVPFSCSKGNAPRGQLDTAGKTPPTHATSSPTAGTDSPLLSQCLLQTSDPHGPAPLEHPANRSPVGSARAYPPYGPRGQANESNAAPTTPSSSSSGFPPTEPQTPHQHYSQQQSSSARSSLQRSSTVGSGQLGMNSSRSLVASKPCPLPLSNTATHTQRIVRTSGIFLDPDAVLSGDKRVYGQYYQLPPPASAMQQARACPPSRSSFPPEPASFTIFPCTPVLQFQNPSALEAFPVPSAGSSSSGSSGANHDALLRARQLTHNHSHQVTSVPTPPLTHVLKPLPYPLGATRSRSEFVLKNNPLLHQIILECVTDSGGTNGGALTSDPDHTLPIPDPNPEPQNILPSPQGLPPTKTVKALADSAWDGSPCQGLEEPLQALNVQENELSSTVSETKPSEDTPVASELLSAQEDGGEVSDTAELRRPMDSGMWETLPASPDSLLWEYTCSEPAILHWGAGGTQSAEAPPDASVEVPDAPGSPKEDLVGLETLNKEPTQEGLREAGAAGRPSTDDPYSFLPVVSLVRLPLLSVAPGCPLPRFIIHAGDTEEEILLEELKEDDDVEELMEDDDMEEVMEDGVEEDNVEEMM